MRLAIHAPTLPFDLSSNVFGKDVANRELYIALARYSGLEEICFCTCDTSARAKLNNFHSTYSDSSVTSISSLVGSSAPILSGTLLRGQPYLSELAWERAHRSGHNSYSLVGMIHTLAPPKVRELIGDVLVSPVQPWDALICTSPAVRDCLNLLLDRWQDYLAHRFSGNSFVRPYLPLLPLGVDQANLLEQRSDNSSRNFLRRYLRLGDNDLLVLWLGRLSYFEKAYPQSMFIALQRASLKCGCRLHFVMAGWFPDVNNNSELYQQSAKRYAPDVPVHFLDGSNQEVVRSCWASADIFLSLVDNPQETFGLSPVEAMAAGVPVVVSDWDGYRYTVSDGVEGFLIPTLAPSYSDQGAELAFQHDHGLLTYQDYVGSMAQHVAVDIDAAVAALVSLANDPSLRQRMGYAGRQTVRNRFDWSVVAQLHLNLYSELAEIRSSGDLPTGSETQHPLRGDPFHDFSSFATSSMSSHTKIVLAISSSDAHHFLANLTSLDLTYQHLHASLPELKRVLFHLQRVGPCSLEVFLSAWPSDQHDVITLSLTWLAKFGCIHWTNSSSF